MAENRFDTTVALPLNALGEWSSTTSYAIGSFVALGNRGYYAVATPTIAISPDTQSVAAVDRMTTGSGNTSYNLATYKQTFTVSQTVTIDAFNIKNLGTPDILYARIGVDTGTTAWDSQTYIEQVDGPFASTDPDGGIAYLYTPITLSPGTTYFIAVARDGQTVGFNVSSVDAGSEESTIMTAVGAYSATALNFVYNQTYTSTKTLGISLYENDSPWRRLGGLDEVTTITSPGDDITVPTSAAVVTYADQAEADAISSAQSYADAIDGVKFESINVVVLTSSGTYNKPSNALYITVEGCGAGASAGGVPEITSSTSQVAIGTGGGAGCYFKRTFAASELDSSCSYTIGAGGAGASAGSNGNNGGQTSFEYTSGTTIYGNGGSAGFTGGPTSNNTMQIGGAGGGSASTQDVTIPGEDGGGGEGHGTSAVSIHFVSGGDGGSSALGKGGKGARNGSTGSVTDIGDQGTGYGSGSGGGYNMETQSARGSLAGQGGVIIITEYLKA